MRARLWLPGHVFGNNDDDPRLWLILADGRVLAFRLAKAVPGDDSVIAALAGAVADDMRGSIWKIEHPAFGQAQVLYAAPVLPAPNKDHAGFLFDPGYQRFARLLDAEVMCLLLALERAPTPAAITRRDGAAPHPLPQRFYASVRNYNRLATLPPELRMRRAQALGRFPALTVPILLTAHPGPNVWGGKRHAWRETDPAVEAAIDAGRDLAAALAQHYRISKGLVRAPVNAAHWPAPSPAMRRRWLALLDALPDNQRPTPADFERWHLYLANYFALLGADDRAASPPQQPAVHRGAFRLGWTRTWETAARRYGDLHACLADCRDFLQAARERAATLLGRPYGPGAGRLAAAWLACHGLLGLFAASARWHRQRPVLDRWQTPDGFRLPAILERHDACGRFATELLSPAELAREGEELRHCVGSYWPDCVAGDRIFALRLADGERATAQYHPSLHDESPHDTRYRLVQLRGPCNGEVSPAMTAWAAVVAVALNAPSRQEARRAALETRSRLDIARVDARRRAAWLDAKSERQLQQTLAWLNQQPLPPEPLLLTHVAGYPHHAGPRLEARFAVGQPLALVREPDNPHDQLAVRLDWQGQKLGYVPRAVNAEIAQRLDSGEPLAARIVEIDPEAPPWQRVAFVVDAPEPRAQARPA
ncbi:HIRAN domain-containing protein [Fontimonas sp. SYSU GA230001]|uniref:HIRAN domain-containing protein n=1 Tax=Fontimonas sp. SYSU GA230001 TaxID=3142450 RepID=UPI0032B49A64